MTTIEELARAIAACPRATHFPVRNLALVEAYVDEHGELPPGVTVVDPSDPSVVMAYVGRGGDGDDFLGIKR